MNPYMIPQEFKYILVFVLLDLVLKGFALWKSARKEQKVWFVSLLVINSFGVFPAIYLLIDKFYKKAPKKK